MNRMHTIDPWRRLRQYDELPGDPPEPVFVLPEDLGAISDAELADLEEQATGLFDELRAGDLDAAAMSDITVVRDAIVALRAEGANRSTAAAERRAAIEAMDAEVHPPESTDEGDPDPDPEADPEAEPEADPEADPAPDPEAEVDPEAEPANQPVPIAAAGRRPALSDVRRHAPAPTRKPGARPAGAGNGQVPITITAAADLQGISPGKRMDLGTVASAMHNKARLLGDRSARAPIATIDYPDTLPVVEGVFSREEIARVTGLEAMTAAGGWCGPLTPFYNLFRLDSVSNLLQLPSVRVARAGISVPSPLLMPANVQTLGFQWDNNNDQNALAGVALANLALTSNVVTVDTGAAHGLQVGDGVVLTTQTAAFLFLNDVCVTVASVTDADTFTFAFTHANVTSGAATGSVVPGKCCIRIPCPTWTDYTLAADGVCVTHGNLQDRSFPEMTREYINLVMNAHQINLSVKALAIIDADANNGGAAINTPEAGSVWSSFFGAIALVAELFRETYRMGDQATLEVIVPQWTKEVLRQDYAARANGLVPTGLTDQMIAAEFNLRNVRPQYISHYQMLSAATAWPSTLNFLVMAPGTYVRGTGGTLDLGVVRDSTLNAVNDFTAAWTEEFWLLAQLGPDAMEGQVTLPAMGCNTANCA